MHDVKTTLAAAREGTVKRICNRLCQLTVFTAATRSLHPEETRASLLRRTKRMLDKQTQPPVVQLPADVADLFSALIVQYEKEEDEAMTNEVNDKKKHSASVDAKSVSVIKKSASTA